MYRIAADGFKGNRMLPDKPWEGFMDYEDIQEAGRRASQSGLSQVRLYVYQYVNYKDGTQIVPFVGIYEKDPNTELWIRKAL